MRRFLKDALIAAVLIEAIFTSEILAALSDGFHPRGGILPMFVATTFLSILAAPWGAFMFGRWRAWRAKKSN